MSSRKPTRENLLETLPLFLRTDESVVKLADAMAQILAQRRKKSTVSGFIPIFSGWMKNCWTS